MLALLVLAGSLKSLQIEIGLIFHFLSLPFPSLKIRDKWFTRDKTCRITEEKPLRVIPVIIYQLWSEQCIVVIVSYSVFSISWLFPLERKVFEKGEWGVEWMISKWVYSCGLFLFPLCSEGLMWFQKYWWKITFWYFIIGLMLHFCLSFKMIPLHTLHFAT